MQILHRCSTIYFGLIPSLFDSNVNIAYFFVEGRIVFGLDLSCHKVHMRHVPPKSRLLNSK
jgi:hypothetical protein